MVIETGVQQVDFRHNGRTVKLTNLEKVFWPELDVTKRDLLEYYATVSKVLIPHLQERAMVMKRYPNGISGDFFFMKRTPANKPDWLQTCPIDHKSGNRIDFPIVNDLPSLLWVVNLGCIDLNPWYSRCDDTNRPDILNFDLDPVAPAGFEEVRKTALILRDYLARHKLRAVPKTSGSRGIHIYVPITRGPLQKQVWTVAKRMALELAEKNPDVITAEYRIAKRPPGRVLVDYNQNAWGRTLASVYSVRPKPGAPVSAPVTWEEIEGGIAMADLNIKTMPARIEALGDLFRPIVLNRRRCDISKLL